MALLSSREGCAFWQQSAQTLKLQNSNFQSCEVQNSTLNKSHIPGSKNSKFHHCKVSNFTFLEFEVNNFCDRCHLFQIFYPRHRGSSRLYQRRNAYHSITLQFSRRLNRKIQIFEREDGTIHTTRSKTVYDYAAIRIPSTKANYVCHSGAELSRRVDRKIDGRDCVPG